MNYDIICPCYWVEQALFENNLKSWIKEIPSEKIFLGVNNPKIYEYLKELQQKYPQIELIDQLHLETLGGCLADLIKKVETEWFVFVHSDVLITPYAFLIMQQYQKKNMGIIESHRELWDGSCTKENGIIIPNLKTSRYYFKERAYSGLQLIQVKAIKSLVDRLEDDYLYRNEDMIFHYECCKNNFKYQKTWAMHLHQNTNSNWTINKRDAHRMQYRGFIKYTIPNEITLKPCLLTIKYMKKKHNESLNTILPFCYQYSPEWAEKIVEGWDI